MLTTTQLLEIDPDLGAQLDAQAFAAAREAIAVRVISVAAGEWAWAEALPAPERLVGLGIGSGVLARRARVHDGCSVDLLGPGDVVRPWSTGRDTSVAIDIEVSWHVLVRGQLVVIDHDLLTCCAQWPQILAAVLDRAVVHSRELAFRQAACGHTRVEDRLWLVLWQIAERFGRSTREGAAIALPGLTHATLASLVAASRPSVTKALRDLQARDLLARSAPGVLLLRGSARDGLVRSRPISFTARPRPMAVAEPL